MRIGIIAALPGELKHLRMPGTRMPVASRSGIDMWQWEQDAHEFVAVCAGMGAAAARRAFTAAEFAGSLDGVLSVGWAGALTADAKPGECYVVGEIVDGQTGERFVGLGDKRLVTTAHVANADEKRRLAASYGASLVDMEAAAVARLAQMRGIPMWCFKAVSDGLGAELPDLNPFIDVDGKLKMVSFLAYVTVRPMYWRSLMELGKNSNEAAHNLANVVGAFLHVGAFEGDRG